ncbi:MAG: ABC transporter permease, partial [Bacilli bacterium]|nr:ABC transporter permease [Bacilli bacterium]
HFVSLGLMVLFYGTPIVYTMDSIPASLKWILSLNPMTHVIEAYRDILYYQRFPDFSNLFMLFVITIICVIIGYTIFNKLQRNFAEEL